MAIPGAIYPIVPFNPIELIEPEAELECPILVDLELNTRLAIPKSPKYAFMSASMRILLGFKSR
jgi:hypothetical protein